MKRSALLLLLLLVLVGCQRGDPPFANGRFDRVWVDLPAGDIRQVVLWLMPGRSRTAIDRRLAAVLRREGALVISVSAPGLLARMAEEDGDCSLPAGDLDNLAREVEAQLGLERYLPPVLAGRGVGAALVYAALAQAPVDGFAGGVSLDFTPALPSGIPLCPGRGLASSFAAEDGISTIAPAALPVSPWMVVAKADSQATTEAFVRQAAGAEWVTLPPLADVAGQGEDVLRAAYRQLTRRWGDQPVVTRLSGDRLPLIEVPAKGAEAPVWALVLSGDGGWAGLGRDLGHALAAQGVSVVGFDSLRYFWGRRTPEGLAADLQRILSQYQARWPDKQPFLIGYSQGANVLPFAYNRLPAEWQARVGRIVLLGPGERAAFTFQVSQWWRSDAGDEEVLPEAGQLPAERTLCVYGRDEASESICPQLKDRLPVLMLRGGHHFDGDMAHLARIALDTPTAAH
ncbi:MAG: AcvB/VirJ family lysyl-phosphatidylglycerol hydrolase [Pseudomonadota bacterium]